MAHQQTIVVEGSVHGQVAAGDFVYQAQSIGGVINQLTIEGDPIRPRARPVDDRPGRPEPVVGRVATEVEVLERVGDGPVQLFGEEGVGRTWLLRDLCHRPEVEATRDGVAYVAARDRPLEDVVQSVFESFFESALPQIGLRPTPDQVRHAMAGVEAFVLVDDVDLPRGDLETLLDVVGGCRAVVTGTTETLLGRGWAMPLHGLDPDAAMAVLDAAAGRFFDGPARDVVQRFCEAVGGHPATLVRVGRQLARGELDLDDLAAIGAERDVRSAALREVTAALGIAERRVLAVLAAVAGGALPTSAVEALSEVDDAGTLLRTLRDAGLVLAASPRFRIAPDVPAVLDLPDWRSTALERLPRWLAAEDDVVEVAEAAPAALSLMRWGVAHRRWTDVRDVAEALAPPLGATCRWGVLRRVLETATDAAEASGDTRALGWALHELGTIDVCSGRAEAGTELLRRAERLRASAGDGDGLAVTRHNLTQAAPVPPPPPPPPPQVPPSTVRRPRPGPPRTGWPGWLRTLLLVIVVAGLGGAAVALWPWSAPPERVGSLEVDARSIDFGRVDVGSDPGDRRLVENVGTGTSDVIVTLEGPDRFQLASDCGPLSPGEVCRLDVGLLTDRPGTYEAAVMIEDERTGATARIDVRGTVVEEADPPPPPCDGSVEIDTTRIDFGLVPEGAVVEEQLDVQNASECAIGSVEAFLERADLFEVDSGCGALDLGESCRVTIRFVADGIGEVDDVLVVVADDRPVTIDVRGSVAAATAILRVDPSEELDLARNDTVTLRASGTAPVELSAIELVSRQSFAIVDSSCPPELQPGEACEVRIAFLGAARDGRYEDLLVIRHSGLNPDVEIPVGVTYIG